MDVHRLIVKVYTEEPGAAPPPHDLVVVLHRWIQTRRFADEVMIDVADYSHVHNGPGVVLMCHGANYGLDQSDGRFGLTFYRKRELVGSLQDRLRAAVRSALTACRHLEGEPSLAGKVRFSANELLFRVGDRLHAPNAPETYGVLEPELLALGRFLFGDIPAEPAGFGAPPVQLARSERREELATVRLRVPGPPRSAASVLDRLA